MKLYYLGSAIDPAVMDEIIQKSRIKPSHAPVYFQMMALKGLKSQHHDMEVHCIPPIKTYPKGSLLCWGRRKENLSDDITSVWLPAINIQLIKHITISISTFFSVLWWIIKNARYKDKLLVSYYIYLPYTIPSLLLCKLFRCKTSAIITDSIDYSYKNSEKRSIKNLLITIVRKLTNKVRNSYDCYIFLTKHMIEVFDIRNKKYIIMEGFSDGSSFSDVEITDKSEFKTIMYAGFLSNDFGVPKLVDAFMKLKGNYQLWIFGSGDCEAYLKECSQMDSRIKFFGKVNRHELLIREKKAHLLVSVKPSCEEHGKYAFPSKILEYMSSGTPVLSTRVGGIPEEYFDYIYSLEDESEKGIITRLSELLSQSEKELKEKGTKAKEFAAEHKSYLVQGERMIGLFKECLNHGKSSN